MRNTFTIAARELSHYFVSPLAYVAIFFFVFISGFIFTLAFTT